MKKLISFLLVFGLLFPSLAIANKFKQRMGQKLYLAHGVWIAGKKANQKFINYKSGELLPAGTEVIEARLVDSFSDSMEGTSRTPDKVSFKVKATGQKVVVEFEKNWHPGKTIFDYYGYMLTGKDFNVLTESMSEEEKTAIKGGYIIPGMNKKAVLASYGYPPEHETESLDSSEWLYWDNKLVRHKICFSGEGLTVVCPEINKL